MLSNNVGILLPDGLYLTIFSYIFNTTEAFARLKVLKRMRHEMRFLVQPTSHVFLLEAG